MNSSPGPTCPWLVRETHGSAPRHQCSSAGSGTAQGANSLALSSGRGLAAQSQAISATCRDRALWHVRFPNPLMKIYSLRRIQIGSKNVSAPPCDYRGASVSRCSRNHSDACRIWWVLWWLLTWNLRDGMFSIRNTEWVRLSGFNLVPCRF